MDGQNVRGVVETLETVMDQYADDGEVQQLAQALIPVLAYLKSAPEGTLLDWAAIPVGRMFEEGGLRRYPDLEDAYACFRIAVTGGDSPALRWLRNGQGNL